MWFKCFDVIPAPSTSARKNPNYSGCIYPNLQTPEFAIMVMPAPLESTSSACS